MVDDSSRPIRLARRVFPAGGNAYQGAAVVPPGSMLKELMDDNKTIAARMRDAHEVAEDHDDVATASLIENWIDEAEKRAWFLYEASRQGDHTGH